MAIEIELSALEAEDPAGTGQAGETDKLRLLVLYIFVTLISFFPTFLFPTQLLSETSVQVSVQPFLWCFVTGHCAVLSFLPWVFLASALVRCLAQAVTLGFTLESAPVRPALQDCRRTPR